MQTETWYKIWCKCGTINWLCDGEISDLTQPDIEGFICHKCKTSHSFIEDDPAWIEVLGGDDPENYDVGLEQPT